MTDHGENMAGWDVSIDFSVISSQSQLFEGGTTQRSRYWNGEKHSIANIPETNVRGLTAEEADFSLNGLQKALLLSPEPFE